MKEAGCVIKPKAVEKDEDKKEDDKKKKPADAAKEAPAVKFEEMDIHHAIQDSRAFDDDQLGYIDFLEALIRVAKAYPFTPEEEAELVGGFTTRMMFFINKLEAKFSKQRDERHARMNNQTQEELNRYQPRIVVDEDDDDDYDMDG